MRNVVFNFGGFHFKVRFCTNICKIKKKSRLNYFLALLIKSMAVSKCIVCWSTHGYFRFCNQHSDYIYNDMLITVHTFLNF